MADRRSVTPVPPPGRLENEERERAEAQRLESEAFSAAQEERERRKEEYARAKKDEEQLLNQAWRKQNRPYLFISGAFLMLFISLVGYLIYFNVCLRDRVLANPYNKRQDTLNEYVIRGDILSRNGEVLAETVFAEDGAEIRTYPYGRLFAHVVGFAVRGRSGLESICNYDLLSSHNAVIDRILNEFEGKRNPGDILLTTLDADLQRAAYDALGDYRGAVAVLDPASGEILAMVSKPDFDPNTIDADWNAIVEDEQSGRLLNRALQGLYPPGSTFKIVTALAYIRSHENYEDFSFQCSGELAGKESTIHCFEGIAHGEEDLESAFANSCNSAFAAIGLEEGAGRLKNAAESLLFNKDIPIALSNRSARFSLREGESEGLIMQTAFGQGNTLATPFQMALAVSAIANGGVLMQPYLVRGTVSRDGTHASETKPKEYGRLISEEEAETLSRLMRAVVSEGTASRLSELPCAVYGKTGSAEYVRSDGSVGTHSWFVGFSEEGIALSVLAEDGGPGSSTAVPIAERVFEAFEQKR
ncbi:MAG: penicillin-binding protein 2 [Lachnospiraceae bacterium]|nr:penicillin-binding protein 2 [Lachnospiraceae bacterium]